MKGYSYLDNERGLSLIELMVAITIAIVVLAPIYEVLLTGNKVQIKSFSQVDLQEKAQQVLNVLVEGQVKNGSREGGIREAGQSQVLPDPAGQGIAFVFNGKLVTYYLADHKIFYKAAAGETVQFSPSGGSPVLENVQSFKIREFIEPDSGKKSYQVTIHTFKNLPANGQNAVTFSTRVRPRNQ